MGNNSSKDGQRSARPETARQPTSPGSATFPRMYSTPGESSSNAESSRPTFRSLIAGSVDLSDDAPVRRKETRQEKEARKLEKERVARLAERERSLREEHVDGGYLVTLGTYVGPEDFSKTTVRQLQIERRLAPFWRGLNDHSDSWTEHQLVAAARGLRIPAPDEVPLEESSAPSVTPTAQRGSASADSDSTPAIPITLRSLSDPNTLSPLSASHPTNPTAATGVSPLFRSRAKTLATVASSKNSSQADLASQEVMLPPEPQINGQPVEAYLYKDVLECPICFLYYPPYLNKTRCCDQPICSECFVQIKRPDPHPPEHTDPNTQPPDTSSETQPDLLMSEPAQCPFCVQPEFGVTYDAPPFKRGLVFPHLHGLSSSYKASSPGSSSSSLPASNNGTPTQTMTRRRTTSLSATAPTVITTDKVRPDWAKKLSDARALAAKRSATATALHTAAYAMGPHASMFGVGRRRRIHVAGSSDSANGSRDHISNMEALLAAIEGESSHGHRRGTGSGDLFPTRFSSRAPPRGEDLEELMMMEAIRQSLVAEEERKKKEDKEAAKQAKKDEKSKAKELKEQKRAEKQTKKGSISGIAIASGENAESGFISPPLGSPAFTQQQTPVQTSQDVTSGSADKVNGSQKGKERATEPEVPYAALVGFNPLSEPTSTLNKDDSPASQQSPASEEDSQPPMNQDDTSSIAKTTSVADSLRDPFRDPFEDPDHEYESARHSQIETDDNDGDDPLYADDQQASSAVAPRGKNPLSKVTTEKSDQYDANHYGDVSFLDGRAHAG